MSARLDEDLYVNGNLSAKTMTVPASSVADLQVAAAANIVTSKVQHKHRHVYGQSGTATTVTIPVHVVRATTPLAGGASATATVIDFRAGSIVACIGTATITVDLQKNGSSILTAVITLNSSSTARTPQAATISSGALVAGDWLDAVITATVSTGTLGTGLLVQLEVDESAQ